MKARLLAGLLLFLALVAGFVILLPESNEPVAGPEPGPVTGNKARVPDVMKTEPADHPGVTLMVNADDEAVEGRGRAIRLSDMSAVQAGDSVAFYIPQEDRSYSGKVSDASVTEAGNRVLTGFLHREERDYRFVFTVGRFQTFGTLHTPAGSYQLETRDGLGRIVSVARIREGLDYTEPDYVIPERKAMPPEEHE